MNVAASVEQVPAKRNNSALAMSIEQIIDSKVLAMDSSRSKHKPDKKHKSKEGKKRKRDREDEDDLARRKSKKHRMHKEVEESSFNVAAKELEPLDDSPFHSQTASIYLPLAPISQRQPLEGICAEHLSPLILTYYPPLGGVILSYNLPRISEKPFEKDSGHVLIKCIDEYGAGFAWVTAEFLLFKPIRGGWLEGYINLQNEGHLGLVCWNLFNASIERRRLPKDWKWVGAEGAEDAAQSSKMVNGKGKYAEEGIGYYVDGNGDKIDGTVRFRVKDIESSHDKERGFLSIEGTMLDEEAEKEVLAREHISNRASKGFPGTGLRGARALGATSLGVPIEKGESGMDSHGFLLKHSGQ